jgi:excisionase family DNA binding protein
MTERYALTRTEAARSIGMGLTTFENYVQPDLRVIRVGRKVLIPAEELRRWVRDNAERVLDQ